jgi:hypothetical protein
MSRWPEGSPPATDCTAKKETTVKLKQHLLSASLLAIVGWALLTPSVASAAPYHRGHKVCHWDRHHHHRVCHWVR